MTKNINCKNKNVVRTKEKTIMKIRTDFVTNSSSSSYCTLTVTLKNGKTIDWSGEDGEAPIFTVPTNAKKLLSEVKNIEELIAFIKKCADDADDERAVDHICDQSDHFQFECSLCASGSGNCLEIYLSSHIEKI